MEQKQYEDLVRIFNSRYGLSIFKDQKLGIVAHAGFRSTDTTLIFSGGVKIDKVLYMEVANKVFELKKEGIESNFYPIDTKVMSDGRFCYYDTISFLELGDKVHRKSNRLGIGYLRNAFFETPRSECQKDLRLSLMNSRRDLMIAPSTLESDLDLYKKQFVDSLRALREAPQRILGMLAIDGMEIPRCSALDSIKIIFHDLDIREIYKISELGRSRIGVMDSLLYNPRNIMPVWCDTVTCLENLIDACITKFPLNDQLMPQAKGENDEEVFRDVLETEPLEQEDGGEIIIDYTKEGSPTEDVFRDL